MTEEPILADCSCPFPGCGTVCEIEDEQRMKSSDPSGYCWVRFYRCAAGHHWPGVIAP